MAGIFGILSREHDIQTHVPAFIGLSMAAGALYLFAVYLVERFALGFAALLVILASGVLFRVLLLPSSPALSDDVYRYQWEGRIERARINPYTVFPAMPGLGWLQEPGHPLQTASTTPSLYPPLSEKVFAYVGTVTGYKQLFTALDLASLALVLLLLRELKQPLHHVVAYAWNPGVVVSFAMCGHLDSLAILPLLAANLSIVVEKQALSIAFLAFSFLAKLFPVVVLPAFLKRTRWANAAIFIGVVVAGYFPFLPAGLQLFRGLRDYAAGWEGNDSFFRLIRYAGNSKAQAGLVAGVLVLGLAAYALKRRLDPLRASLLLTAGLLLLSPNAFPWYFTWSIPFLCFYSSVPWLLMSVSSVLGYAPVVAYAEGQPYRDSPLILALEYLPVYLWLACEAWLAIRKPKSA